LPTASDLVSSECRRGRLIKEMGDQGLLEDHAFLAPAAPRPAKPRLVVIAAVVATLISLGTCTGAILARPPALAIPLIVAICVGGPIFAGWDVPRAIAALRVDRGATALARLRRRLAELPEIEHPLGY
jgi:hypothetical protein